MDLKDKKCVPCSTYVPPLAMDEKVKLLAELGSGWTLTQENSRLRREYKFKNFKRALEWANEIGRLAEAEKHHPEIFLGWGHCDVEIWTHMNNNLLENDFILADKLNESFKRLFPGA